MDPEIFKKGIIIGQSDIPIYSNILELLEQFWFDQNDAEKYIKANKHNHLTTTYYLLLKRYQRLGKNLILKQPQDDLPDDPETATESVMNRSAQNPL